MIYKIKILDKHSYKSGMVLRYGLGAWTCHPGGLGLSPAEEISSFLCKICQFLQFFYGLNNFEIQKWGIFFFDTYALKGGIHKPCGHGRGEGGLSKCPCYYISFI